MCNMIEGIGDEVLWLFVALLFVVFICVAWISTGIPPIEYYVWLIQMQIFPQPRVVQVLHMDHEDAGIFENHLAQRRNNANSANVLLPSASVSNEAANESEGSNLASDAINEHSEAGDDTDENRIGGQTRRILLSRVSIQLQEGNNSSSSTSDIRPVASSSPVVASRIGSVLGQLSSTNELSNHINNITSNGTFSLSQALDTSVECRTVSSDCKKNQGNIDAVVTESNDSSTVKLKFLDDTQMVAPTALEATVGQFKMRYFTESITAGKVVRLIFRGQLLRDDSRSLSSYGLYDQCVLHCHISSAPYTQPNNGSFRTQATSAHDGNASSIGNTNSQMIRSAAAAAIAAIAGSSSTTTYAVGQFIRRVPQTYQGQNIEDNSNDSLLTRLCNAFRRGLRHGHNLILGPQSETEQRTEGSLDEAANAAMENWNQRQQNSDTGGHIGQYLHAIFIVKFVLLWLFVFFHPQYTDRFSLLLLTLFTAVFAVLLLSSRNGDAATVTPIS